MTMETPYRKTDKVIDYMNRQYGRLFRKAASFDELNVIPLSHEIYDAVYAMVKKEATRLAGVIYSDHRDEDETEGEFDATGFVLALLLAYNPVTKYVFENELDRKRARFAESLIASNTPLEEIALAKRLVAGMDAQFMDDVTFEAVVQAFRDNGTERVRWVTAEDDRRCKKCKSMHGKIYPIDEIPPKPHIHCRCWVEEVEL